MKIIIDCFGGDNSPFAQVEGAIQAVNANENLNIVLVGKSDLINVELEKYDFDEQRVEVLNADEVITCEDKPTVAIREKKNASLTVGYDLLKNDDDCAALVSSGSSGAILAGSIMKIGRIKGVSRPALAAFLPTVKDGGRVMLIDCGANADCKPINLLHFAVMGISYYKKVLNEKKPRVAILANGTEDEKGNELTKAAFSLVSQIKDIEFLGNIEARDIVSGNIDIVVADGFSGNVALKAIEGSAMMCLKCVKSEITNGFFAKLGALILKGKFKNVKKKMDYSSFGGAPVLGVEKIVIKVHGSAKAKSVKAAVLQAYDVSKQDIVSIIADGINEFGQIEENV